MRKSFALILGATAVGMCIGLRAADQGNETRNRQEDAKRHGGLEAAASITGSYFGTSATDEGAPVNLGQLVSFSELIIQGIPETNRSRLTSDKTDIVMDHSVRVVSVLKGQVELRDPITIMTPGGRVGFKDGSWAQMNSPGFVKPVPGHSYILFLRQMKGGDGNNPVYVPAFGPLGVYDTSILPLRPSGGFDYRFATQIVVKRYTIDSFLVEVRQLIAASR